MTIDQLTALLAKRVMGWRVGPDRFLMGGRQWQPRHRFQPTERMADAYRLLEKAAAQEYRLEAVQGGRFRAVVRIGGVSGESTESSQARALTFAIARALGLGTGREARAQRGHHGL